jgi:hypothetical protein
LALKKQLPAVVYAFVGSHFGVRRRGFGHSTYFRRGGCAITLVQKRNLSHLPNHVKFWSANCRGWGGLGGGGGRGQNPRRGGFGLGATPQQKPRRRGN